MVIEFGKMQWCSVGQRQRGSVNRMCISILGTMPKKKQYNNGAVRQCLTGQTLLQLKTQSCQTMFFWTNVVVIENAEFSLIVLSASILCVSHAHFVENTNYTTFSKAIIQFPIETQTNHISQSLLMDMHQTPKRRVS